MELVPEQTSNKAKEENLNLSNIHKGIKSVRGYKRSEVVDILPKLWLLKNGSGTIVSSLLYC